MRTWIAEGRVTLDSLVWREGWPEWKKAGPLFPGLLSANAVANDVDVPQIVTEVDQGSSMDELWPGGRDKEFGDQNRGGHKLIIAQSFGLQTIGRNLSRPLLVYQVNLRSAEQPKLE